MSEIKTERLVINNNAWGGQRNILTYLWIGDKDDNYVGSIDKIVELNKLIKMCERTIKNINKSKQK